MLDLTHPSSEINKSPTPGIERELGWLLRTTPSAERPRLSGQAYIHTTYSIHKASDKTNSLLISVEDEQEGAQQGKG